jgi:flagellar hook assembly protein FlgD
VSLKIYNVRGELVRTLLDGDTPAGSYVTTWDGKNATGEKLPSGLYFCTIHTQVRNMTLKLLLAK